MKSPESLCSLFLTSLDDLPDRIMMEKVIKDSKPFYIMPWNRGVPDLRDHLSPSFFCDPSIYEAGYGHLFFDNGLQHIDGDSKDMDLIKSARDEQLKGVRDLYSENAYISIKANLESGKLNHDMLKKYLILSKGYGMNQEENIVINAINRLILE